MKYVILIHSNPQPWGHPTQKFTDESRALPKERHDQMDRDFDALLREISESGELVTAEALAEPAEATVYAWSPAGQLASDGPYAEAKEHLAGFFLVDCATRERAEQIAARFAQPGGTVELRPVWTFDDVQNPTAS
ncbi:MAG TPA: YciI family protein [Streptosporangiales bacterium]